MTSESKVLGLFFVGVAIGTLFPKEFMPLGLIVTLLIATFFYLIEDIFKHFIKEKKWKLKPKI